MYKEKKFASKLAPTVAKSPFISSTQKFGILENSVTLKLFESPVEITSMCPTIEDDTFVCCRGNEEITLLSPNGEIKSQWNCEIGIQDISVRIDDQVVFMCCPGDRTVRKLPEAGPIPEIVFFTRNFPLCLCVLQSNDILIGEPNHIKMYDMFGIVLCETKLYSRPIRIRECPVSGNIAIIDSPISDEEDDMGPSIVILNAQLELIARFIRDTEMTFNPTDIMFDSTGALLFCDGGSMDICVLDPKGKFISTIFTSSCVQRPSSSICIQLDNTLWSKMQGDTVRLLKFKE